MSQSVKVYYVENQETKEIRKFSLEKDVAGNYEYLVAKIRQTFPALLRKDIEIFWKDEEDEYITISSDEELHQALEFVHLSNSLLKLYVKVKKSQEQTKSNASEEEREHTGITCDGCNSAVRGIRYKCTQCYDFDLCSDCQKKSLHPSDHEMICIKLPRTMNHFMRHPGCMRGCRRGAYGGRGTAGRGGRCGPSGRGGPYTRPGGFGWRFPPPFGFPPHDPSHPHHEHPHDPQHSHPHDPNHPHPHTQTEEPETSCPNGQDDWRSSMPECIRMMANTLGFDPDVATNYFEAYFGEIPRDRRQEDEEENTNEDSKNDANKNEAESKNNDESAHVSQQDSTKSSNIQNDGDIPMQDVSTDSLGVDLTVTEDTNQQRKESLPDQNLECPQEEQTEAVSTEQPSQREEFTLVDQEKEGEMSLTEEEKFQKRLDKALKQMEAMGFDNEGGWLKQLLVSKELSIGRVLDALNPPN